MPLTDTGILTILSQGGAWALAVWLVYFVVKSGEKREERLMNLLQIQSDKMDRVAEIMARLEIWLRKTE